MGNRICDIEGCGQPHRAKGLCGVHYMRLRDHGSTDRPVQPGRRTRRPVIPAPVRFWSKVDKDGPIPAHRPQLGACWSWGGQRDPDGYGKFKVGGITKTAHRWGFIDQRGAVPEGLSLDHLCHDPRDCDGGTTCPHRRCVNPNHLEPVTNAENIRRGATGKAKRAWTHCRRGHPFDEANTLLRGPEMYRICRACARIRRQRSAA